MEVGLGREKKRPKGKRQAQKEEQQGEQLRLSLSRRGLSLPGGWQEVMGTLRPLLSPG